MIDLSKVKIPFKVRCIEEDPMDERVGIPEENRWKVGEEAVIHKVQMHVFGTFLYINAEQNIDIRRVELVDDKTDEEILKETGWTITCHSPFEIEHFDGSSASGLAASYCLDGIIQDYKDNL